MRKPNLNMEGKPYREDVNALWGLPVEDVVSVTADYTAGRESVILVDTTGGNITVTLPLSSHIYGWRWTVKKIAAGNTLTVAATSPDTIDGASTVAWTVQYEARTFIAG